MNTFTCIGIAKGKYIITDNTGAKVEVSEEKLIEIIKSGKATVSNLNIVDNDIRILGVPQAMCSGKEKDKYGNILSYNLVDSSGNTIKVKAEALKVAMQNLKIDVLNLQITAANRINDKNIQNGIKPVAVVTETKPKEVQQAPVQQAPVQQAPVQQAPVQQKHKAKQYRFSKYFTDKSINPKTSELDKKIMVKGLAKNYKLLQYVDNDIISAEVDQYMDDVTVRFLANTEGKLCNIQGLIEYTKANIADIKDAAKKITFHFAELHNMVCTRIKLNNVHVLYPEIEMSFSILE